MNQPGKRTVTCLARPQLGALVRVTSAESSGPTLISTWRGQDRPPQKFHAWTNLRKPKPRD